MACNFFDKRKVEAVAFLSTRGARLLDCDRKPLNESRTKTSKKRLRALFLNAGKTGKIFFIYTVMTYSKGVQKTSGRGFPEAYQIYGISPYSGNIKLSFNNQIMKGRGK